MQWGKAGKEAKERDFTAEGQRRERSRGGEFNAKGQSRQRGKVPVLQGITGENY
jgi:hypothetical protein